MSLVRLLQPSPIIIRELNIKRPNSLINMLNLSSPDDRRVHPLVQQPCKGDLSRCHSFLLCNLFHAFHNVKVFWTEEPLREIFVSPVSRRGRSLSPLVYSRQESSCQWAPGDQADSLILT